ISFPPGAGVAAPARLSPRTKPPLSSSSPPVPAAQAAVSSASPPASATRKGRRFMFPTSRRHRGAVGETTNNAAPRFQRKVKKTDRLAAGALYGDGRGDAGGDEQASATEHGREAGSGTIVVA